MLYVFELRAEIVTIYGSKMVTISQRIVQTYTKYANIATRLYFPYFFYNISQSIQKLHLTCKLSIYYRWVVVEILTLYTDNIHYTTQLFVKVLVIHPCDRKKLDMWKEFIRLIRRLYYQFCDSSQAYKRIKLYSNKDVDIFQNLYIY